MPEERVINTSQSADLVTFTILVEGEELSSRVQVKNIVVEKEINRIPNAQIVIIDGDPAAQEFKVSDQDLFVPGKEVEIKAGYHSDEETVFKGIVIKHSLKIRSRQSFLIVECKDKAVKMTIGRKSKYFYESTDSDILEEIIDGYSLEKEIETTNVTHQKLVQYNVSDWDFCIIRAQANGKVCMVDEGKIIIAKPDVTQDEIQTVSYGATLLDFDAEIDARNQLQKVTSYGWSPADQELLELEGNDPGISLNGNLTSEELAGVTSPENFELKNGGEGSDSELQEWANAKWLFNQMAKVRGRMKFQGIPEVKLGIVLKLAGVGDRFNGKVYISGIRHQLAEGNWTVDAEFGINPKWFSETFDINDLPAAGLVAAVNGLQIGIVTQLESDPDGEDRILVKLPIIDKDEEGIWARIATLDAGDSRGSFFRPEIGDEVIVGFINENPNDAVVLGMMNSSAKPAPLTTSDDNHEKGFVTRSEMKLIFNDDKKTVTIETPGGNMLTLDEDQGGVFLEDENGNKATFNSDGITLESAADLILKAMGDVNIEGTNVSVAANAQFKAEGSAGAEVSSSATAILKGAIVQIN
mgnify:CR=1 FL=1